jgi:hypothetical protein
MTNGPSAREMLFGDAGYGAATKAPAPVVGEAEKAAKATREQASEAERLLDSLTDQLARTKGLTTEQELLGKIGRGAIGGINAGLEQQLLLTAVLIDKAKEQARINDLAAKAALDRIAAYDRAESDAADGVTRDIERIRSLVDPTRELYRELDRVRELAAAGLIPTDVANARQATLLSQIDGVLQGTTPAIKEADDAAKQLGLTFSSAFEDAIVGGKQLSTVLQGLAQDVLRIVVRQTVTKPLADFVTGSLAGLFPARAAGGPVSGGMPYLVGEKGPELMVPGSSGTVVPAGKFGGGVTINQVVNVGSGVNRNDVAAAMVAAKESAKAEILQSMRRGGAYAVA